ncbi:hypothetical protein PMAYCL1PPCAC_21477 [Pristionchus mayeri]|uniref:DM domain-containing protein n=1 Tax=Pristionchus mayeri TaxID=1317129 RepID=A0AAN5I408_9BILA|nr:hypothetical protein PMAYCL1PPCAC_21477 [Pristionchus mayeri]
MTMVDQTQPLTFFNYSKQIPRGVKRHCGLCRQHGFKAEISKHACPFKQCTCAKCHLISQRRAIMSSQIRLRRQQDKKFVKTTEPGQAEVFPPTTSSNARYLCQKCKNHGILSWKKHHKLMCKFTDCNCFLCVLIDSRRALDMHIKSSRNRSSLGEDPGMIVELDGEPEVSTSTSSLSTSGVQTPSLSGFDLRPLTALGFSTTPVRSIADTTPFLPTPPIDQMISNELLMQTLTQQRSPISNPSQVDLAPFYSPVAVPVSSSLTPTPPSPSVNYVTFTLPAPPNGTSLTVLYHQNQEPPSIHNYEPAIPQFNANPSTTLPSLNHLTEMDIHNLVSTLMRSSRVPNF